MEGNRKLSKTNLMLAIIVIVTVAIAVAMLSLPKLKAQIETAIKGSETIENSYTEGTTNQVNISATEGGNVIATLADDGTLTISGSGAMKDFSSSESIVNLFNSAEITKVVIENGVTNIGNYAFNGCSTLTSIEIPEGVTTIGNDAFNKCYGLTSIEIPEGVTTIGKSAFESCNNLESINIPEGLTNIQDSTFLLCIKLTNVIIPNSVTSIGKDAFNGCSSLVRIDIPEGVTSIGNFAFYQCTSLTNIDIPNTVTSLGTDTFSGCSNLQSIEIPEGVTSLEYQIFANCTSLTEVIIPEGVTSIGTSAFSGCSSLISINIPSTVTSLRYGAFWGCSSLTKLLISNNVTNIQGRVFSGCENLTIICHSNSTIATYAEDNSVNYQIDDNGPKVNFTSNGTTIPVKGIETTITIEDEVAGLVEESIKYLGTTQSEDVTKEQIVNNLQNGETINITEITDTYYLWVYAKDNLGNESIVRSEAFVIDNTLPTIEVNYSTTEPTNQNITVRITANEEIQAVEGWTLSEDKKVLTKEYTENDTETITVKDIAGNETQQAIEITNIDKIVPKVQLNYNTQEKTNQNVTITIISDKELQEQEGWTLSEDKKVLTKEYSENTTETITVKDIAGNETQVEVEITNIDKTVPIARVSYSTTEPTNQSITVTIKANEKVQDIEGWTLSEDEKTLTKEYSENTTETITVKDIAGNEIQQAIEIANIDKELPIVQVSYSTAEKTKENVTVTITTNEEVQAIEGWTLSEDKKVLTKEYTENDTETITVKDMAGNETQSEISISNIDKVAPEAEISYSATEPTNQNVIVKITVDEEIQPIEGWILSEDKKTLTKEYNENATEIITVKDLAGNEEQQTIEISNIDKTLPTVQLNYSTQEKTNQNVTVTIIASEEVQAMEGWTLSKDKKVLTKEYSENAIESVVIKDLVGNEVPIEVQISNIDKVLPIVKLSYNITEKTNQNVIVTITADKELQGIEGWTLSEDKKVLTKEYSANTTETITVKDLSGNEVPTEVQIANIDKSAPIVQVNYSTQEETNQNVNVTIVSNEEMQEIEGWTLSEDKKVITKEYSDNISETIIIKDILGNEIQQAIEITNIDKTLPSAEVNYAINEDKNVIVTITANEEIQSLEGWTLSEDKKTLTKEYSENTTETITVKDMAGNEIQLQVNVSNIDKVAPEVEVSYSTTEQTNQNVIVTITANEEIQPIDGWTLLEDKKVLTKEYNQNTTETITVKDIAGNEIKQKIEIKNIDKTVPEVEVEYSVEENENVKVTIKSDEELQEVEGWILSEDKKVLTKEYSENTKETIKIKDISGNEIDVEIEVTQVKAIFKEDTYEIKDKFITRVKPDTTYDEFIKNIQTTREYKVMENDEVEVTGDMLIKTGQKLLINNKEYILVVIGDINADGTTNIVDLSNLMLAVVEKIKLEGEYREAADVNSDGHPLQITDVSKMTLYIVGKVTLEGEYKEASDVNNDGNATQITDLSKMKLYIVGKNL